MRLQIKESKAKTVAFSGIITALALIFSYVESLIPFSFGIPGIRLGLANLVKVSALYYLSPVNVLTILVLRILISGFMFGNMYVIIYSLAGGLLSFAFMLLFKKLDFLSRFGVSIIGGVTHNIGQVIVASFILSNVAILSYLPVLIVAGTVSGFLIGIVSEKIGDGPF